MPSRVRTQPAGLPAERASACRPAFSTVGSCVIVGVVSLKICAILPTYDNAATVETVVRDVRAHVQDVIVVDDGSGADAVAAAQRLAEQKLAHVVFRPVNGGKGAAVKSGLAEAARLGFTHALQIDADGQHRADDVPRLLGESAAHPDALVLGQPVFDDSAPRGRKIARKSV